MQVLRFVNHTYGTDRQRFAVGIADSISNQVPICDNFNGTVEVNNLGENFLHEINVLTNRVPDRGDDCIIYVADKVAGYWSLNDSQHLSAEARILVHDHHHVVHHKTRGYASRNVARMARGHGSFDDIFG